MKVNIHWLGNRHRHWSEWVHLYCAGFSVEDQHNGFHQSFPSFDVVHCWTHKEKSSFWEWRKKKRRTASADDAAKCNVFLIYFDWCNLAAPHTLIPPRLFFPNKYHFYNRINFTLGHRLNLCRLHADTGWMGDVHSVVITKLILEAAVVSSICNYSCWKGERLPLSSKWFQIINWKDFQPAEPAVCAQNREKLQTN